MHKLEWPATSVENNKTPEYEWAYIKAALEGYNNGDSYKTYVAMFGEKPKSKTPYWLVRLAIYYGALKLGYDRCKKKMNGVDQKMLACVSKLDEKALRNDVVLWKHMWLHDVELAEYGGRELVE